MMMLRVMCCMLLGMWCLKVFIDWWFFVFDYIVIVSMVRVVILMLLVVDVELLLMNMSMFVVSSDDLFRLFILMMLKLFDCVMVERKNVWKVVLVVFIELNVLGLLNLRMMKIVVFRMNSSIVVMIVSLECSD